MKTILELTLNEASTVICDAKGVDSVRFTDATSVPVSPTGMNFVEAVMRVTQIEYPPSRIATYKIAAIKRLRELVPSLGLADAKYAVETPHAEIEKYLLRNPVKLFVK
jgi:ribosomal protein L7/L12